MIYQEPSINGNLLNMIIFNKFKTGDPFLDAIFTTIIITCITYFIQFIYNFIYTKCDNQKIYLIFENYFNKYSVQYEGRISFSTNIFDCKIYQTSAFGDNFKALWNHIIENINNNKNIYHIKEYNFNNYNNLISSKNENLYIVSQSNKFLISKEFDIYANTTVSNDTEEIEDKGKTKSNLNKITKISIKLFSNSSDTTKIRNFVDNLTKKYLSNIADLRVNKHFIYTLRKNEFSEDTCEMWNENLFSSTVKFSNIFFQEKKFFLDKLDFFLNNHS